MWTSAAVCVVLKQSCDVHHEALLAAAGSLSAVRGDEGADRSLHREQSDANPESSAIVFLGDHQVKILPIPGSSSAGQPFYVFLVLNCLAAVTVILMSTYSTHNKCIQYTYI